MNLCSGAFVRHPQRLSPPRVHAQMPSAALAALPRRRLRRLPAPCAIPANQTPARAAQMRSPRLDQPPNQAKMLSLRSGGTARAPRRRRRRGTLAVPAAHNARRGFAPTNTKTARTKVRAEHNPYHSTGFFIVSEILPLAASTLLTQTVMTSLTVRMSLG